MLKEWMKGEQIRKFIQGGRRVRQQPRLKYFDFDGNKKMENKGRNQKRMGKHFARVQGPSRAVVPKRKEGKEKIKKEKNVTNKIICSQHEMLYKSN